MLSQHILLVSQISTGCPSLVSFFSCTCFNFRWRLVLIYPCMIADARLSYRLLETAGVAFRQDHLCFQVGHVSVQAQTTDGLIVFIVCRAVEASSPQSISHPVVSSSSWISCCYFLR